MFRLILNGLIALALTGLSIAPVQASRIMKPDQTSFLKGVEPGVPAASSGITATFQGGQSQYINYGYSTANFTFNFEAGFNLVIVGVDDQAVSSITVGGSSLGSPLLSINNGGVQRLYVYGYTAGSSGSATLAVSYAYNLQIHAAVYSLTGATGTVGDTIAAITDASISTRTATGTPLVVPTDHIGIFILYKNGSAGTDMTWGGVTEVYDAGRGDSPTSNRLTIAYATADASPTYTGAGSYVASFIGITIS